MSVHGAWLTVVAYTAAACMLVTAIWTGEHHTLTSRALFVGGLACLILAPKLRCNLTHVKPGQVACSMEDFQRAEQLQKDSIAQGHGESCILQEKRNQRDRVSRLGA